MKRPRLSYANVTATLALVLAMSGTGIAASHYIITNVRQIKPSVRVQLRGARGPEGVQGPLGPQGLRGLVNTGNPGPTGAEGSRGPTGLQGYKGVEGYRGERGVQGCGQKPNREWEANVAYVQPCTDSNGAHPWSYVVDEGREYVCVAGVEHDGEAGVYCRSTKSPSEQIAEEEASKGVVKSEWRVKP